MLVAAGGASAEPPEAQAFDAEAAFEALKKGLVGEWQGTLEPISKPVEATPEVPAEASVR